MRARAHARPAGRRAARVSRRPMAGSLADAAAVRPDGWHRDTPARRAPRTARALADADIVEGDARENGLGSCRVILAFDVLHMMPRAAQDALLTALGGALDAGGVMLVREA